MDVKILMDARLQRTSDNSLYKSPTPLVIFSPFVLIHALDCYNSNITLILIHFRYFFQHSHDFITSPILFHTFILRYSFSFPSFRFFFHNFSFWPFSFFLIPNFIFFYFFSFHNPFFSCFFFFLLTHFFLFYFFFHLLLFLFPLLPLFLFFLRFSLPLAFFQ